MNTSTVKSIPEYLSAVLDVVADWKPQRVWFRGQSSSSWALIPSAYRTGAGTMEASAFNAFWARARGLRDFSHLHPEHDWDWYFAARHHGMETRLLDWSASPIVALYFAMLEATPATPARIWVVDPYSMNSASYGDNFLYIPACGGHDFVDSWLPEHVSPGYPTSFQYEGQSLTNEKPIAIYPSHTNARLIAQHGAFTVHGSNQHPLDVQWESWRNDGRCVRACAIDFASDDVAVVQRQLEHLGMTGFQVFPDGDHLAMQVNNFYRMTKSDP